MQPFEKYLLELDRTPLVESAYELYTGEPMEEGVADFAKAALLAGALAFSGANAAPSKHVDSYHPKNASTIVQKGDAVNAQKAKKIGKKGKINKQVAKMRMQNLSFDTEFQDRVDEIANDLIRANPNMDYQIAQEKAKQKAMAEKAMAKKK